MNASARGAASVAPRNRRLAVLVGVLVFIGSYAGLYWILFVTNYDPIRVYRSRSLLYSSLYWLESLAFAPTIWLAQPLGKWASSNSADLLGVVTLCEVLILSGLYASIAYLAVRGQLRESVDRLTRGQSWILPMVWAGLVIAALSRELWQ